MACQLLASTRPIFAGSMRLREAPKGDADPLCLLRAYRVARRDEALPDGKCWFLRGDAALIEDAVEEM